jgi:predicted transcriptional regulator
LSSRFVVDTIINLAITFAKNQKEAETILIRTIMNHPPLLEATPLDSVFTISNLMKEGIVNDNNTLVGIVTVTDIIKYFHKIKMITILQKI